MKTALITGGNTGIGAAIAKAFAEKGYALIINYLEKPKQAEQLAKKLKTKVILVKGDITKKSTVQALRKAVQGRLDVLVNNAGINKRKNFKTATKEDWLKTYEINVAAPFNLMQALSPMLKKSKGSIVNIASIRAREPSVQDIAYSASKAALVNLTKNAAKALYPVRVNSISPGPTDTRMQCGKKAHQKTAMKRLGEPDEIAHMVLAVAENTFMTGSDVVVDGRATIFFPKRQNGLD